MAEKTPKLETGKKSKKDTLKVGKLDNTQKPVEGVEKQEPAQETNQEVKKWEKKVFNAAVVDTTRLVEAQARDIGDHKMAESKEDRDKGWFRKTITRIWKHNMFQEYYRQKEISKARGEILTSKNLYIGEDGVAGKAAHKEAMNAIVDRFTSEYEQEALRKEERESKTKASEAVNAEVKQLIKDYAGNPGMSDEAFAEAKNRVLAKYDRKFDSKNKLYADNLGDIAREVRDAVTHGQKLNELDFDVKVILGQARESLQTEQGKHTFDKILNTMGKSAVGQLLVNAGAVGIVAGAYSLTKVATVGFGKKAAKWFGFGAGAVAAGGLEALKENTRIKRDRAQHIRERAKGMTFNEADMKRRPEMEENLYEMRGARDISTQLEADIARIESKGMTAVELNSAMANLANLEARIQLGDQRKLDLIQYSSFSTIERERADLDLARARLKVAIRRGITAKTIAFTQTASFDNHLASLVAVESEQMVGGSAGIEAKDKIFNKLKRKAVAKAFVKGTVMAAGLGFVFQEATSFLHGDTDNVISGSLKSIRDHLPGGKVQDMLNEHSGPLDHNATSLEAFRRWAMNESPRLPFGTGHEMMLDSETHTSLQMPDGVTVTPNPDGTSDILRGGEVIARNICLDPDANGHLLPAAEQALRENDIHVDYTVSGEKTTSTVTESAKDWVEKNIKGLHHVSRQWMGNDTPMYPDPDRPGHLLGADLNELRTHWAGVKGTGISADGHYQLNVQHMTNDGSFQDGVSVAAADERGAGALKALLSVTKDSQQFVIEVPISKEGLIDIDPASPEGQMLFQNVNGHAVYTGAFLEIAKPNGVTADGREIMQMLSTHIGTDNAHDITKTITTDTIVHNIKMDVPDNWDYDTPIPIPVLARRPLERGAPGVPKMPEVISSPEGPVAPVYPYYYGEPMDRKEWTKDFSPRIKKNPEAKLDPSTEIAWYFKAQEKRYPGYVAELQKLAKQSPEPMGSKAEAAVCLAVAGHQEHDNIYRTLQTYAVQKDEKGGDFWKGKDSTSEIFIYVNWPSGKDPKKTQEEIERFKKDYPNVVLHVYNQEIDTGKVEVGWYKKKIIDLALLKHSERKVKQDLLVMLNDADMTYTAPNYLAESIKTMNDPKNEKLDAILGRYDLDSTVYEKYPTFHAAMRFWQFMEATMRSKNNMVGTQGRNTIMRGSSYAAVGGNRTKDFWADLEFGQLFDEARQKSSVGYENKAWVMVDPRREIDKFKSGEHIAHTWSDFNTREVRGKSSFNVPEDVDVEKLASLPEDHPAVVEFKKRFRDEIQEIINLFSHISPGYATTLEYNQKHIINTKVLAERAAGFLGIEVKLHDHESGFTIEITDSSKLRQWLKRYREENRKDTKIKDNPLYPGYEGKTKSKPDDLLASTEATPVVATTTPEVKSDSPKMPANTDFVYSLMSDSPSSVENNIGARINTYVNTGVSQHPAFMIFESDPNRREVMQAKVAELKAQYPEAYIEYVPLPETDRGSLKDKTYKEYMQEVLAEKRGEAGVSASVNQVVDKIEIGGSIESTFKKE